MGWGGASSGETSGEGPSFIRFVPGSFGPASPLPRSYVCVCVYDRMILDHALAPGTQVELGKGRVCACEEAEFFVGRAGMLLLACRIVEGEVCCRLLLGSEDGGAGRGGFSAPVLQGRTGRERKIPRVASGLQCGVCVRLRELVVRL